MNFHHINLFNVLPTKVKEFASIKRNELGIVVLVYKGPKFGGEMRLLEAF